MSRFSKLQSPSHRASFCISAGIAAAIALSMASPVLAADTAGDTAAAPAAAQAAPRASDVEPITGTHIRRDDQPTQLDVIQVGGAVRGPGEAGWEDNDTSVPALPMTREQASGKH